MKKNKYTHSKKLDYPSISQIAHIAKNTSTSIIFAVSGQTAEYRLLAQGIPSKLTYY